MSIKLEPAFVAYARLVRSAFASPAKRPRGMLSAITNPVARTRDLVETVEGTPAFDDLISTTREAFPERDSAHTGRSVWQHAVKTFFRRSGFYLAASRSRRPPLEK